MAPEQMQPLKGHSYDVDVWALGVILYNLITGQCPFPCKDLEEFKTLFSTDFFKINFPTNVKLSH